MNDEIKGYERAYLGGIINKADLLQEYRLSPDDFHLSSLGRIMQAILDVEAAGGIPDYVTVYAKLNAQDQKGFADINDNSLTANTRFYFEKVLEASRRRRLRTLGQRIVEQSAAQTSEETVQDIEQALLEIHDNTHAGYIRIGEAVHDAIKRIEDAFNRKGKLGGLPTGIAALDGFTDGLQPEEVIIIGARPGSGKTAISLNMVEAMVSAGHTVGYFSAEMSRGLLVQRLLSSLSGIPNSQIRSGMLTSGDFKSLSDAAETIFEQRIMLNDTSNIKLPDMLNEARRMKRRENVEAIFVDYMSLVTHTRSELPRHEQVADVSRNMKRIARELQVPVIALSQVTRDTQGRPPTLANIRESGAVEQDADVVLFLHPIEEPNNGLQRVDLIVAKNRNGAAGTSIELMFNQKTVTFHEVSHEPAA